MKVALIDCDGVVADFGRHTLDLLGMQDVPSSEIKTWSMTDVFSDRKGDMEGLWATPEFWATLPLIDGAVDGVKNIERKGYDIVWLTSGYEPCPLWWHLRLNWLRENFGTHDHALCAMHKKWLVDGSFFVDDKLSHVKKWRAHQGRPTEARGKSRPSARLR